MLLLILSLYHLVYKNPRSCGSPIDIGACRVSNIGRISVDIVVASNVLHGSFVALKCGA